MLGYPVATYAVGGGPAQSAAVTPPPDSNTGGTPVMIDATKVPAARKVVFEGSVRMVIFEGGRRMVVFE